MLSPIPEVAAENAVGQTVIAAVIGGTVSELSGGKFANGAITGAFQFAVGRALSGSGQGDDISEADDVSVTGCGSKYGCSPTTFWGSEVPEYLLPPANPALDRVAISTLQSVRPRPNGEWHGYIRFRGPTGYVASTPRFAKYEETTNGLKVVTGIPRDAVAVYHTHPLFKSLAANRLQTPFGPRDAEVVYSHGASNYLRPPVGPMSVLQMTPMGPLPRELQ